MSTDKPTAEERQASTQPGCKCTAHCEHHWGDQAPTADELEIDRLRCLVRELTAANDCLTKVLQQEEVEAVRTARAEERRAWVDAIAGAPLSPVVKVMLLAARGGP